MDLGGAERIGGAPRRSRFDPTFPLLALTAIVISGAAYFGVQPDKLKGELERVGLVKRADYGALYERLGVAPLDARIEAAGDVDAGLAKLGREPCDSKAVFKLTEAVAKAGEERWAAQALVGWSKQCGTGTEGDLRKAASLYLDLHDFPRALAIATQLTDEHPGISDYWYLRGKAEAGLRRTEEALLSYANTIQLAPQPKAVGAWVFREMSDLYASEGRWCQAIDPIEDYVARDPGSRDTSAERKRVDDLSARGHCVARAAGAQTFPVVDGNVIRTRVTIDGATGTFAVDTGASFCSVTPGFARRAHLTGFAKLHAMTANGAVISDLAVASTVRVGHVEARQVPVAILDSGMGNLDGLLGRSFLSRFDVTIGATRWSLKPRSRVAAQ